MVCVLYFRIILIFKNYKATKILRKIINIFYYFFYSGLRHPNLVLFMGSCHDKQTKEMFLVMEFMTRGSLHDVLHNKSVCFL